VKDDDSRWEQVEELHSKNDEGAGQTQTESKKVKQKKSVHLDEFVQKQGRGGRENRGRGRSNRGERNNRQERVKLDDPNAFPALGKQ
jgi:hypothetical protein